MGSVPESGSSPGGGHDNPLQYLCLENPKDRGTSWATVRVVSKSRTRLSIHTQNIKKKKKNCIFTWVLDGYV